jgi:organic hydroperoxide reductase OsmC/OhrA
MGKSPYTVKILWKKNPDENFIEKKYSRAHKWIFDCGIELNASSSPHVVPLPFSDENAVDPEEAYIASISSCHMLWFLFLAAEKNLVVESYEDIASGSLKKNNEGKLAMTEVYLNPVIKFLGKNPSSEELEEIHHFAHEKCFIANSIKTKIIINNHHF